MNVLLSNWVVKIMGKASKNDLDRILSRTAIVIVLGEESYWEEIYLLNVSSTCGAPSFYIAVYSERSTTPSILCHKERAILTIGYNHELAVIDLSAPKIMIRK